MFDHQHRDPHLAADVVDPPAHVLRFLDRQARGRFVQQQKPRFRGQRAAHFDHLAHTVGQARDALVAVGLQIKEVDHLFHSLAMRAFFAADAGQVKQLFDQVGLPVAVAAHKKIVQHRRLIEQFDVLERAGDAQAGHLVGWQFQQVFAVKCDLALDRCVKPRNQVEDRRFASAVGAHQGENLALFHVHAQLVHGGQPAEFQRDVFKRQKTHLSRSVFR